MTAVAVCTFRRELQLTQLIERIVDLAPTELPDHRVTIAIIDDSPQGSADACVQKLRDGRNDEITYHLSASSDIAKARIMAFGIAAVGSDYVVCIDDDCLPNPGWLRALTRTASQFSADIVVGHRRFVAAPDAPKWLHRQPFLAENVQYPDGSVPTFGNTANMLVRSEWLRRTRLQFRTDLGLVGGEDMVFFADARQIGAEIRFAAQSVCDELCTGRRATFRYQAWRQVWLGNNEAVINRATKAYSTTRMLARGGKHVLRGFAHPLRRVAQRKSPQWRWSLALIGRGIGLQIGVLGIRMRHHA